MYISGALWQLSDEARQLLKIKIALSSMHVSSEDMTYNPCMSISYAL